MVKSIDIPEIDNPYEITSVCQKLINFIKEREWTKEQLVFNLTGGTKPMALAAYHLAEEFGSPFLYLQSEGSRSLVYQYQFADRGVKLIKTEELPPLLTIDDYLRAYLGEYQEGPPKEEPVKVIYEFLRSEVDEIKTSIRHGGALRN